MDTVARSILTPIAFLAHQEKLKRPEWPSDFSDRRNWQRTARIVKNKLTVAERFIREQLAAQPGEDSELRKELRDARIATIDAHKRAVRLQLTRIRGPKASQETERLRDRYDTLKASIKTIFLLLGVSDLTQYIERVM